MVFAVGTNRETYEFKLISLHFVCSLSHANVVQYEPFYNTSEELDREDLGICLVVIIDRNAPK